MDSLMIDQQVRLSCPWARHFKIASTVLFSGYTGSNSWQLDSKTAKVPSLFCDRGNLANKPAKLQGKHLCWVYTCRFDNQVPNGKLVKKYFLVVKLEHYFVCEEDRKLASYCKQEIRVFKQL